jgi:hypothetical protein
VPERLGVALGRRDSRSAPRVVHRRHGIPVERTTKKRGGTQRGHSGGCTTRQQVGRTHTVNNALVLCNSSVNFFLLRVLLALLRGPLPPMHRLLVRLLHAALACDVEDPQVVLGLGVGRLLRVPMAPWSSYY